MQLTKEAEPYFITFELEEVEKRFNNVVNFCVTYVNINLQEYKGVALRISPIVGFFRGDEIAAFADRVYENSYSIEMNMPSWSVIYNFSHNIVLQPPIKKLFYDYLQRELTDDLLAFYAEVINDMMIKILVFHELGHIYNGHIDYIKQKEKEYGVKEDSKAFSTSGKKARPFIEPNVWQALEWNADDFSATRMVGIFTHKENLNHLGIDDCFSMFLMVISAISLYTLMEMGIKANYPVNYKEQEHLPKRYRLEKYVDTLFQAYKYILNKEFGGFNKKLVTETLIPFFETNAECFMKSYFEDYKNISISIDNNKEELDDAHRKYYEKVDRDYMIMLKKELEGYAFFEVVDNETLFKGEILKLLY
ncbi:hypothetical protein [Oribacterium sp. P6A1]|uniref:hypothetical protein n=1 Tax=Oribacterium sp. P6A1 TaxID=1410612 RepID=UPI00056446A7|nr:hypothetical protein [Oribacterium sp. P6A1]